MPMRAIERGESWMTEEERLLIRKFTRSLRALLSSRGVEETPLAALRMADVAIHLLLAKRLETALTPGADMQAATPGITGTLAEQVSKGRERLRKAVRELEDACARVGKPLDKGLAEEMLPLVRKTGDMLQHAVPSDGPARAKKA